MGWFVIYYGSIIVYQPQNDRDDPTPNMPRVVGGVPHGRIVYRRQTEVGADGVVCYDYYCCCCYELQNTIETTPNPNTPRVLEFKC